VGDDMNAEIFQVVKLFNRNIYQVSVRELLGIHAMAHRITSYLTQELPEGWEEKPNKKKNLTIGEN